MNAFIKLTVVLCIVFTVCAIKIDDGEDELCSERTLVILDAKMSKFMPIGDSGRKLPETKEQAKKFCNETFAVLQEIDLYRKKCLKDLLKQLVSMMVYAGRKNYRTLCRGDSPLLTKLLDAAPCANQGSKQLTKCYFKSIDSIAGIQNEPDDRKKIPHLCCEFVRFMSCAKTNLIGLSKCSPQRVDLMNDFVITSSGGAMDMACGEYSADSDKCDTLGPPPKRKKSQKRPRSIIVPMFEILNSFPEV